VGLGAHMDQGSEVAVNGHENSLLVSRLAQERFVARIATERSHLNDIVTLFAQPFGEPPSGAAIDEKPHAVFTRTASMLSLAIAARAYARQARMSSASSSG